MRRAIVVNKTFDMVKREAVAFFLSIDILKYALVIG